MPVPTEDSTTMSLRTYLSRLGYLPQFVRSAEGRRLWGRRKMPWELWESARLAAFTQDDRDYAREQRHHRRYGQRSVKESAGWSVGPHSDRLS
jgi:hypothetical protein